MKKTLVISAACLGLLAACTGTEDTADTKPANAATEAPAKEVVNTCTNAGPQTPRDITFKAGTNMADFPMAGNTKNMNLCNIHTHTNAEHKGPGFKMFVNDTDSGGYACNGTTDLTEAETTPLPGAFKGAKPGDTIEVHWVHTSCDIQPGEGLGSCLSETCTDPLLRVETQIFLVVNDSEAANFMDYAYQGNVVKGKHQPKALPKGTGKPVVFRGSTTGPSYNQTDTCSPFKVTWSVRPRCQKLDMASLHEWAESGNVFNEKKSHGVRQLVTKPELISPIGQ